jgi:protein-disulfide isomerase
MSGAGRLVPVVSVIAAVAVAVVALTSLHHQGSGSAVSPGLRTAGPKAQAVDNLLAGIPQSGSRLGSRRAPVQVVLYGDLESPISATLTTSVGFTHFVASDVRGGKVQLDYRSLCTATCNNHGQRLFDIQQAAAYAAGRQNLFWQYALLFMREQGKQTSDSVTSRYLSSLAKQIPALYLKDWREARVSTSLIDQVKREETAATKAQITGTPTLVFQGRKAVVIVATSPISYRRLDRAVHAAESGCPPHWAPLGGGSCKARA